MRILTLTPLARADMRDIWVYSKQKWGVTKAEQYVTRINAAFVQLLETPEIGVSCDEIIAFSRKYACQTHIIFYKVLEDELKVVRVLHQSIDLPKVFE